MFSITIPGKHSNPAEYHGSLKKTGFARSIVAMSVAAVMAVGLTACGASESAPGTAVGGGTVHIALNANVTSLDPMMTGAYVARDTMRNIYETLVTLDADGKVQDLLAASHKVSSDNKTFTFTLRKGVKFHDGTEMTADDVVASMQRWIKLSQSGHTFFDGSTVEKKDDSTVVITSPTPVSQGLYIMADSGRIAAIMPKSVIDAADDTGVKKYIGTGPFKFASWTKDQNIVLDKFADYQSPSGSTNGYAGARKPHADHLEFDFVTDGTTRMSSTLSGQYEVGYSLPDSQYSQLKSSSDVKVQEDEMLETLLFNKKQGIFSGNKALRQAILAALDMDKIAKAGHQSADLYKLDGGLMPKNSPLRSEASLDNYNQANASRAKQLLAKSGYNGEKISFITTKDYPYMYDETMEIQTELKTIGINTDVQVYDWATCLQKMFQPDQWEMMISSYSYSASPIVYSFFQASGAGYNTDPQFTQIASEINTASSDDAVKKGMDDLQTWFYDYVPNIIISKYKQISAVSNKTAGYSGGMQGPVFYNMSLTE